MSQPSPRLALSFVALLVALLPLGWSPARAEEGAPATTGAPCASPCAGAQQAGEQVTQVPTPAKAPCPCSQAHPADPAAERVEGSPCHKPCGKKKAGAPAKARP